MPSEGEKCLRSWGEEVVKWIKRYSGVRSTLAVQSQRTDWPMKGMLSLRSLLEDTTPGRILFLWPHYAAGLAWISSIMAFLCDSKLTVCVVLSTLRPLSRFQSYLSQRLSETWQSSPWGSPSISLFVSEPTGRIWFSSKVVLFNI